MRTQTTRMLCSIHVLWCVVCVHVSVCLALQFHAIRSGGMRLVTLCTHVFMLLAGWLAHHLPSSEQVCIVQHMPYYERDCRALCFLTFDSISAVPCCCARGSDDEGALCCAAPCTLCSSLFHHSRVFSAPLTPHAMIAQTTHTLASIPRSPKHSHDHRHVCFFPNENDTRWCARCAVCARLLCLARRTVFATVD